MQLSSVRSIISAVAMVGGIIIPLIAAIGIIASG